jgi:hypothetical protein
MQFWERAHCAKIVDIGLFNKDLRVGLAKREGFHLSTDSNDAAHRMSVPSIEAVLNRVDRDTRAADCSGKVIHLTVFVLVWWVTMDDDAPCSPFWRILSLSKARRAETIIFPQSHIRGFMDDSLWQY